MPWQFPPNTKAARRRQAWARPPQRMLNEMCQGPREEEHDKVHPFWLCKIRLNSCKILQNHIKSSSNLFCGGYYSTMLVFRRDTSDAPHVAPGQGTRLRLARIWSLNLAKSSRFSSRNCIGCRQKANNHGKLRFYGVLLVGLSDYSMSLCDLENLRDAS